MAPQVLKCTYCGNQYSKREHLLRHERTHTGAKPFRCDLCGKMFSRRDTLLRHSRMHSRSNAFPDSTVSHDTAYNVEQNDHILHQDIDDSGHSFVDSLIMYNNGHVNTSANIYSNMESNSTAEWPESSDFLDILMSGADDGISALNPLSPSHPGLLQPFPTPIVERFQDLSNESIECQAIHQLSQIVNDQASSLKQEVLLTGITSEFLDLCMHMFFTRFIPIFPVIHQPTFVLEECPQPLLLHMFALGSLFTEATYAKQKGEVLWKLAHSAGAATWQTLLSQKADNDTCNGVGLLLTSLLGQAYASLSKNKSIRATSQTLHALGFQWARQCGMLNIEDQDDQPLPSITMDPSEKLQKWKLWSALETQRRAVLGTYILDGQIAQLSGSPAITNHLSNPLGLSSSEDAFRATTTDEWIMKMGVENQAPILYRDIFISLFYTETTWQARHLSIFSLQVILEGLQSLVSESHGESGQRFGKPSTTQVNDSLFRLYRYQLCHFPLHSKKGMETILRWHSICLDLTINTAQLCQKVCHNFGIEQHIYSRSQNFRTPLNFSTWASNVKSRKAMLHALAIRDIIEDLPLNRLHALYIPIALFAAATVFAAYRISGASSIEVPRTINWQEVGAYHHSQEMDSTSGTLGSLPTETVAFLRGDISRSVPTRVSRNILCDFNALQMAMKTVSDRWGIAVEMAQHLAKWTQCGT